MKQTSSAMRSYGVLTVIYLILAATLPANHIVRNEYHLTALQYHILLIVTLLPIVAVWATAFYGYAQLKGYAKSLSTSREGGDFHQLARGSKWLVWGFPIPSIISLILNSIVNSHPGFKAADTIIINYIDLLVPLIAFSILSNASRGLIDHARLRLTVQGIKAVMTTFVIFGVMYCFFTFRQLNLIHAGSTINPFYLPTWLVVLTITIPYLFAWFAGLFAAYEIAIYGQKAHGIIYRRPTRILAFGVGLVTVGSISLQYLISITPRSGHLSLDALLITTYFIRFITGGGYILIATGASRLRRIEEV